MKAEFNADQLVAALMFVSKGIRGKKARERAKALLTFGSDDISVDFNDVSANCPAVVSGPGKYAFNPFIFRPFIETYGNSNVSIDIDRDGVKIGRLHLAHLRIHGRFDDPDAAIESWAKLWGTQSAKRQKRLIKEKESSDLQRQAREDKLLDARYVSFKRTDGGIEYGAAVLKYEKGKPGNRKVYVKTKDFLEVWINELEIVSYGPAPALIE